MAVNWHFDWLAPLYERFIHPPADPARLASLLDLPCDGPTLDAGGGTGRVGRVLAPLARKWVIADLSGPMLRQAVKIPASGISFSQARVGRLPFASGSFARAIVVDALHHFNDQPGALADLARVLAPGGRLLVEEPDITTRGVKLIALAEKLALMGSHFSTGEEIAAMMASAGLASAIERDGHGTVWVIGVK